MSVYASLGVTPIINAKGPSTRVSGGLLSPVVTTAMAEAAGLCVDMADLQAAASRVISRVTGAEAGIVTAGAAAGLLLGAAACLARLDPARMAQLPDTAGMPNEIIVVRSQRNAYDHAVRAAGARLVEVGLPDRFSGAGIRDAELWEIAAAITPATAAILYVLTPHSQPPLTEVVALAHQHRLPVLVDAAAQLPPVANLRALPATGADLIAFSGGKAINGPQGSGILCGRRDLIMSAALQNLDLDLDWNSWNPPPDLIDKQLLPGLPTHGIGRSAKIGKETIVGLLTALELFTAESDDARHARHLQILTQLRQLAPGLPFTLRPGSVPLLALAAANARQALAELQNGQPAIHLDPAKLDHGLLQINPTCLRPDDLPVLASRLRAVVVPSSEL
jgi:D-glucosaminate-6-phosphate ammonia-lyase